MGRKAGIMKKEYDFKNGKRGPVIQSTKGKTRITIRIDDDILEWFRQQVQKAGGGNYQTLINMALRDYINSKREPLEETLRHVIREELSAYDKREKNVMTIKVIKTEEDHLKALSRIDDLMDAEPNTPEGDELELLVALVEQYEEEKFPIKEPVLKKGE
jgi:uncharacterized protein (DUF4415 family)